MNGSDMTQGITQSTTNALAALVAAFALLLAVPLAIAALETNSITGPTMRAFEGTPAGQVVGSFSADADAAFSHGAQLSKARGQASFFCFAWQCRGYYRTSASWSGTRLTTTWHITRPRNMLYHADCMIYAKMIIRVNSAGGVASSLSRCD